MTHTELLAILQETGIPWAYHHWEQKQEPPYGVYLDQRDYPFYADDLPYVTFLGTQLEIYSLERNPALDDRVRAALDRAKIPYEVDYAWIETEGLYETIFEIEV